MKQAFLNILLCSAASMIFSLNAIAATDISPPNYGRYQVSSWSTQIDTDTAIIGAFIIDTATGETRTVYTRLIDKNGHGNILKNDLKKPFHSVK